MTMKKSDVHDITIRAGGGPSGNESAGADKPAGIGVAAPETIGQPSGAPSTFTDDNRPYDHNQVDGNTGGSGLTQPPGQMPVENSLHDAAPGAIRVGYPAAADKTSAGPVGSGQGLAGSEITGSKVSYPVAADTSMKGKDVSSFMPSGK